MRKRCRIERQISDVDPVKLLIWLRSPYKTPQEAGAMWNTVV